MTTLPEAHGILAVVFGASQWPLARQFEPAVQFRNSADAIHQYIRSTEGLGVSDDKILNLFDDQRSASEQILAISSFIQTHVDFCTNVDLNKVTDLIFYFIGHGGFDDGPGSTYFLAIRTTNEIDPLGSSITLSSIRRIIRENGRRFRNFLILDCCFAAAAVAPFFHQAAVTQSVVAQFRESFPGRGTALLCASGASIPAKTRKDAAMTMFSHAAIDVLEARDEKSALSLYDLSLRIDEKLRELYNGEAARPEVHCPIQSDGSITHVPIFRRGLTLRDRETSPTLGIINLPTRRHTLRAPTATEVPPQVKADYRAKIAGIHVDYHAWNLYSPEVQHHLIHISRVLRNNMVSNYNIFMNICLAPILVWITVILLDYYTSSDGIDSQVVPAYIAWAIIFLIPSIIVFVKLSSTITGEFSRYDIRKILIIIKDNTPRNDRLVRDLFTVSRGIAGDGNFASDISIRSLRIKATIIVATLLFGIVFTVVSGS